MKYLKYLIVLFGFAVAVSIGMDYKIKSNTPTFLLNKFEELRSSSSLMDSIGGYSSFEYSYNKEDFKNKDTLKYLIKISGYKRRLIYKGFQLKTGKSWSLINENLKIE